MDGISSYATAWPVWVSAPWILARGVRWTPWQPQPTVIALGSPTPYWSKSPRYLPPKTVSNFLSLEERKKLDLRAIVDRVVKGIVICWRIPSVENGILYHVLLQPCPETVNLQKDSGTKTMSKADPHGRQEAKSTEYLPVRSKLHETSLESHGKQKKRDIDLQSYSKA